MLSSAQIEKLVSCLILIFDILCYIKSHSCKIPAINDIARKLINYSDNVCLNRLIRITSSKE